MRGQFVRADGLILPNNISRIGATAILKGAFQNAGMAATLYVGLVVGAPDVDMQLQDMSEPTVGINGYGRKAIARSIVGWPTNGLNAGEAYISTDFLTWTATGAGFDQPIQRLALFNTNTVAPNNDILALSSPMVAPINIGVSTPIEQRQFKYQIFI